MKIILWLFLQSTFTASLLFKNVKKKINITATLLKPIIPKVTAEGSIWLDYHCLFYNYQLIMASKV